MNNDLRLDIASKTIRFINHFIDLIGFYFLIFLNAMILDGWLEIIPEGGSPFLGIYFFVLFVLYHLFLEYLFGKTLGKFLTRTKVVNSEGIKPNFKMLFIRNICRLIPFNALSFLLAERGWHDSISKTYVIHQ